MSKMLKALLSANKEKVTKKVHMPRFGGEFEVAPLTMDEVLQLSEQAEVNGKVDEFELNSLMLAKAIVDPNFNDKEVRDDAGAIDGAHAIRKVLYAGEFYHLVSELNKISGHDQTFDERVEEIKN